MNGAHDLGGMHGFGPVEPEPDEPVFHHEWERRCFALTLAAGFLGRWSIDASRYARERMAPAEYLASSYYEHWLHGLERLLVERGLVTERELAEGRPRAPRDAALVPLAGRRVAEVLARGGSARRPDEEPRRRPRFSVGDAVRARNLHPEGHIRLPRYVRGRTGEVVRDQGVYVFPDTSAAGEPERPVRLYAVRFEAAQLWGPQGGAGDAVHLDLFEDYLEPAPEAAAR